MSATVVTEVQPTTTTYAAMPSTIYTTATMPITYSGTPSFATTSGLSTSPSCVVHPPVAISADVFEKLENGTITTEEIDMIMGQTTNVTSTPAPLTTNSLTTPTPTTMSATTETDASGKSKNTDSTKKNVCC